MYQFNNTCVALPLLIYTIWLLHVLLYWLWTCPTLLTVDSPTVLYWMDIFYCIDYGNVLLYSIDHGHVLLYWLRTLPTLLYWLWTCPTVMTMERCYCIDSFILLKSKIQIIVFPDVVTHLQQSGQSWSSSTAGSTDCYGSQGNRAKIRGLRCLLQILSKHRRKRPGSLLQVCSGKRDKINWRRSKFICFQIII